MTVDDLRLLGTGYTGKEPFETVADIVRALIEAVGPAGELGIEAGMTTRPFTAQVVDPVRLGTIHPGRRAGRGADRQVRDMGDALRLLTNAGAAVRPWDLSDASVPLGAAVVIGPLEVPDVWCPPADRLLFGGAWRYLLLLDHLGDELMCLDPIVGGPIMVARTTVEPPSRAHLVDLTELRDHRDQLARLALVEGCRARLGSRSDDGRDHHGYRQLAARAPDLIRRPAAVRLRLSLDGQALHAMRWGGLVGAVGGFSSDRWALAGVLEEVRTACRRGSAALVEGDVATVAGVLTEMADLGLAIDELAQNIVVEAS